MSFENRPQDFLRDVSAVLEGVRAIHEHLRFDDGHESGFLTQGRIAGQSVRVGFDARPAGNVVPNGDDCAPLGKTEAHLSVFGQTVAQPVEAFGDFLSGMAGQVLGTGIHFDARNDSRIDHDLDK